MECDDMLDVIHFMLEEDMFVGSAAEIESKSKTRETIYRIFYDRKYQYGVSSSRSSSSDADKDFYADGTYIPSDIEKEGFQTDEIIVPFDPSEPPIQKTHKPYIPATEFNENSPQPFGRLIDGPIGG